MIINTGGRTDTVNYYSTWLLNRFQEGYVLVRNPYYPRTVHKYKLSPDIVDCVVFCSKNYLPILPRLHEITNRFNTFFHYTITAYGKDIEPGVPSIEESIEILLQLEKIVGSSRLAWRYDPVFLTRDYTIETHIQTFERIASKLRGHISLCIFSFVEMYKKVLSNMPDLRPVSETDMCVLAKYLGTIAQKYAIPIQTCGHKEDFSQYGIGHSGCMTPLILGSANGCVFKKISGKGSGSATRKGCGCMPSRDIGAYDTCLNACRYCYANRHPKVAFENMKLHNPDSPLLLGELHSDDIVKPGLQDSFLTGARSLF